MKKLLLLCACLWALRLPMAFAQTSAPQTVVVLVEEYSDLTITINGGTSYHDQVLVTGKVMRQNPQAKGDALQGVFDKLFAQGYKLQGTYGGADHYVARNTLIFSKS